MAFGVGVTCAQGMDNRSHGVHGITPNLAEKLFKPRFPGLDLTIITPTASANSWISGAHSGPVNSSISPL